MEKQLPMGWVESTLGDVCTNPQYGYTTKATDRGTIKLLRTTDITGGRINWSTVPFCSENPKEPEKYLLEKDDIVISRAGSVGVSYLLKEIERAVFASYLIRFKSLINKQFFQFFLNSPFYWNQISENKLGIAIPNVNATKLKEIPFSLPPLNEQKRIVAKIEELFSELDSGIASLKTAREQLKIYRQAVLKYAFEGKLTAQWRKENKVSPWSEEKLENLIGFLTSGSRGWAKYYSGSGDIFIRAQNLKYDRLDLNDIAFVSLPKESEGKRTQVQVGDILITITGANVTKTGRVISDIGTAYVSQHVALCRPVEQIDSEFMYWFLIAESAGRKQLNKFAYGAGKPGLNLGNIRSVVLNLPSIEEQHIIVDKIKKLLLVEEENIANIDSELQRAELLRQSILKKAFSGQLVPQDSNDEPASELLARIKAEKEADKASSIKNKSATKNGRKTTAKEPA